MSRPAVLCPTDFSTASQSALRYAVAVAEHFGARLIVLTVNDPLLTEVAEMSLGPSWMPEDSERELRRFVDQTLKHRSVGAVDVDIEIAAGKPAPEILRVAHERGCDLIVMSTHGLTGFRKLFFGATTERVLRETTVPVLLAPATDSGPPDAAAIRRAVRRVLAPVDVSPASDDQVRVAGGVAEALGAALLLTHVIEPLRFPLPAHVSLPSIDAERRARVEQALDALLAKVPSGVKAEALVAYGDPAEEIAKLARDRKAGLIVMGLHGSPLTGPRMGSVTYRVLCLTGALVLALPPAKQPSATEPLVRAKVAVAPGV